ncbi:MAG TPA: hypothetical protein VLJ17_14430 [Xanthobacteraceae bacterium]|nr:hypothetical protein [Xanthobacteraceae bacterium]
MKVVAKVVLFAATGAAMVGVDGQSAVGQYTPANTGWWGTEIPAKDIDPAIRAAADALGLIRDTRLVIGQVNLLEYVGSGTMVDVESTPPGRQIEVSKVSYAVALQIPASRLDFEAANVRTVRVVKKGRAWNEERPGINPSPSSNAAYRAQAMWLMPHAAIHAAVFASAKKCLDGKTCDVPLQVARENGKTVLTTAVNGISYQTTLDPSNRPERVEATIALPGGASKKVVSIYSAYSNGQSLGQTALDKFHTGTYWPGRIVQEIDGAKVLDITLTEGWSNPYQIFPEPELLAKGR